MLVVGKGMFRSPATRFHSLRSHLHFFYYYYYYFGMDIVQGHFHPTCCKRWLTKGQKGDDLLMHLLVTSIVSVLRIPAFEYEYVISCKDDLACVLPWISWNFDLRIALRIKKKYIWVRNTLYSSKRGLALLPQCDLAPKLASFEDKLCLSSLLSISLVSHLPTSQSQVRSLFGTHSQIECIFYTHLWHLALTGICCILYCILYIYIDIHMLYIIM